MPAPQTLAEMQKLSTESLLAGVVDEIINSDPVMPRIPFETINATQKRWLRESTIPTPQFFAIDEELSDGVGTKTEVTLAPVSIGHQVRTAGFANTLENVQSQRAVNVRDGLKGLMEVIGDKVVYGNNSSSTKEFNGLHALVPSAQTLNEGTTATGSALNLSTVYSGFDLVKNGRVQLLTVTRAVKNRFAAFVNFSSTNTPIRESVDQFGQIITIFNETPLVFSDRQTQTETIATSTFSAKTGGATSSLFMLQFGMPNSANPGIFGIQGPRGMVTTAIGWDQNKDNWIDRVVWDLALGLGSTKSVAVIDGITDAAVAA